MKPASIAGILRRAMRCGMVSAVATAISGCALVPRDQFTALDQASAAVPGYAAGRIWADSSAASIARMIASPLLQPSARHEVNELALSGGGAGGSYAAGLLKGWSESGKRPDFDVVTGVSTGALIAPLAFLGSDFDPLLKQVYTGDEASEVASPSLVQIASNSGLLDPQPLRDMIERYVTPDLLSRIAVEHLKGRRLLVVTTNLDAQRPVLWNLGAIAVSGRPDALALFREILLASASIPAVYPPVMIDAQTVHGGITEMHVDGGTSLQVYSWPDILLAGSHVSANERSRIHLWVVVNNTLPPEFAVTRDGILPVAVRSFSTLMKSQTRGIVTASYEAALRLGIDFNLTYIDRPAPYDPAHPFARGYRSLVYGIGEAEGRDGTAWHKTPTNIEILSQR